MGTSLVVQWFQRRASNARGVGLIPDWGAKIWQVLWQKKQNIKQKQYGNKFNKDFKNG